MKFLTRICLVWWRSGEEGRDETDKETNEGEGGDNRNRLQCGQSFCYLLCNTQLTFKTNLKLTSMWSPPSLKEEDGLRPLACVQSPPITWGSSPQLTLTLFTSWALDVHCTIIAMHWYIAHLLFTTLTSLWPKCVLWKIVTSTIYFKVDSASKPRCANSVF